MKSREPDRLFDWYERYFALRQTEAGDYQVSFQTDKLNTRLSNLAAAGVRVDTEIGENEFGRFAWVFDPDGNRIELWEPVAASESLIDLPEAE
ncbi:MAG: hypothetical protein J7501_01480 [Bdellovibrio sp.]|nr:hypothetical protein [Bdellovibrio sp.]